MDFSPGEAISKINEFATKVKFPAEVAGFIWGATAGNAPFNTGKTAPLFGQQLPYWANPAWRMKDFLTQVGIGNVTVAPGYTSSSGMKLFFKPLGWVNAGLFAYIGTELLHQAFPGRETGTLKKVVQPFAKWYAIGGIIDPAITVRGGSAATGTQSVRGVGRAAAMVGNQAMFAQYGVSAN